MKKTKALKKRNMVNSYGIKQQKHHVTIYTCKEILLMDMLKIFKRIGLDLSFQSEARWKAEQKSAFITSLIKKMAPSPIILINIPKCMEKVSKGSQDYKYLETWHLKGYEYISVDGNNRTITIHEFLNGEVTIQHGDYFLRDDNGDVVDIVQVNHTNDTYDTLDESMRKYLDNIFISICEYISATRSDFSELFVNINSGVALNPQELRNAILVPLASDIRELVEQFRSTAFKFLISDNTRRLIDEQIVNLAVYNAYGAKHGITRTDKDNAYKDDSSVSDYFYNGGRKLIEETLQMIADYADAGFKEVSTLMNFFIVMVYLNKNGYKILDRKELFKWFMSTENKRLNDSTPLAKSKVGEYRPYSGCNASNGNIFLKARYDRIVLDLQSISKEIACKTDPERLFTAEERYEMWKRQNGICPLTGKNIPEEEINNHTLWSGDHIFPHSKGGPTTLENAQLVCKKANLKKSDKINYEAADLLN